MEKRWSRYAVNAMKEACAFETHGNPAMDLRSAFVMLPEGVQLSDAALDTLRHFSYYTNQNGICVLLGERTACLIRGDTVEEALEAACEEAGDVTGRMPDFQLLPMDDGCTLLAMGAETYTFRGERIPEGDLAMGLVLRQECLEACEAFEPLAVAWFDGRERE